MAENDSNNSFHFKPFNAVMRNICGRNPGLMLQEGADFVDPPPIQDQSQSTSAPVEPRSRAGAAAAKAALAAMIPGRHKRNKTEAAAQLETAHALEGTNANDSFALSSSSSGGESLSDCSSRTSATLDESLVSVISGSSSAANRSTDHEVPDTSTPPPPLSAPSTPLPPLDPPVAAPPPLPLAPVAAAPNVTSNATAPVTSQAANTRRIGPRVTVVVNRNNNRNDAVASGGSSSAAPAPEIAPAPPRTRALMQAAALQAGSGHANLPIAANASVPNSGILRERPPAYWLHMQDKASHLTAVRAKVSEVVEHDGSSSRVTREYVFYGSSLNSLVSHSVKTPGWVDSLNLLTSQGISHTGFCSAPSGTTRLHRRTTAKVLSLKTPSCICLDVPLPGSTPEAPKYPVHRHDSWFPPIDSTINNVIELELLSAERTKRLVASCVERVDLLNATAASQLAAVFDPATTAPLMTNALAISEAERLKRDLWSQRPRTFEDVGAAIEAIGTSAQPKTHLALDPHHHVPFLDLCRDSFTYFPAMPMEERAKQIVTLLALPSLHLRDDLEGVNSNKREAHLRAQLAGQVCTKKDLARPPPPVGAPSEAVSIATTAAAHLGKAGTRPQLSEMEAAARRIVKVLKLARSRRIGAAYKTLNRVAAPDLSIHDSYVKLLGYHPLSELFTCTLPGTPLHTAETVPVDAIRKLVKKHCREISPGPSRWTFELLNIALVDAAFAVSFRNFVLDMMNGVLPLHLDKLLALCNLIGIGKENDPTGLRPIAMGETFLKIAQLCAVERERPNLTRIFRGTQRGCGEPSGAEIIVHNVREFVKHGTRPSTGFRSGKYRVVLTYDAKNAFNSVFRDSIRKLIEHYGLAGLQGVFKTAYSHHAKMFVVGSNGQYTVSSQCGARQGTPDGTVLFSIAIQPALDKIRDTHEGTDVEGYLDDLSTLSDNVQAALLAFLVIHDHFKDIGLELNFSKCELMMPGLVDDGPIEQYEDRVRAALNDAGVPADSPLRQFKIASGVKLLGAQIATTAQEEEGRLFAKAKAKFDAQLDRFRQLPASPQAFVLLRNCFLPSFIHLSRVHHTDVTEKLMKYFDAQIRHLVHSWAQSKPFTLVQQALLGAPLKLGGLGIPSCAVSAPAAHAASLLSWMSSRLGQKNNISQRHINLACQRLVAQQVAAVEPSVPIHLERMAPGSSVLANTVTARVSEDTMAAYLRLALRTPSEKAASSAEAAYACPGCQSIAVGRLANNIASANAGTSVADLKPIHQWMDHSCGCAASPGGWITKRHNNTRDELHRMLIAAGFHSVEKEPRKLRLYNCGCGLMSLQHDAYVAHKQVCVHASEKVRTQGPDLLFAEPNGQLLALDVRVVNELAPSNEGKSLESLFAAAEDSKEKMYGAICAAHHPVIVLRTFAVSAFGALSIGSKGILTMIAKHSKTDPRDLYSRISCVVAAGTAQALLAAESAVGIRPLPRTLSIATLKLLSEKLSLPLAKVATGDLAPRLGIPAPSESDLARQLQSVQVLVEQARRATGEVLEMARKMQRADAEEKRRNASETDDIRQGLNAAATRIVPLRSRSRPDGSSPHDPVAAAPTPLQTRLDTVQALHEARVHSIENNRRNIALQVEAVRRSTSTTYERVAAEQASLERDIAQLNDDVDMEARIMDANVRNAETEASMHEHVANTISQATSELRARSKSMSQMKQAYERAVVAEAQALEAAERQREASSQAAARNTAVVAIGLGSVHTAQSAFRAAEQQYAEVVASHNSNSQAHHANVARRNSQQSSAASTPGCEYLGPPQSSHLGQQDPNMRAFSFSPAPVPPNVWQGPPPPGWQGPSPGWQPPPPPGWQGPPPPGWSQQQGFFAPQQQQGPPPPPSQQLYQHQHGGSHPFEQQQAPLDYAAQRALMYGNRKSQGGSSSASGSAAASSSASQSLFQRAASVANSVASFISGDGPKRDLSVVQHNVANATVMKPPSKSASMFNYNNNNHSSNNGVSRSSASVAPSRGTNTVSATRALSMSTTPLQEQLPPAASSSQTGSRRNSLQSAPSSSGPAVTASPDSPVPRRAPAIERQDDSEDDDDDSPRPSRPENFVSSGDSPLAHRPDTPVGRK